jgi:hypothetical protein
MFSLPRNSYDLVWVNSFRMKKWLVTMWLDSSCEEFTYATQRRALDVANALMDDYHGRLSALYITRPNGTVDFIVRSTIAP